MAGLTGSCRQPGDTVWQSWMAVPTVPAMSRAKRKWLRRYAEAMRRMGVRWSDEANRRQYRKKWWERRLHLGGCGPVPLV